MEELKTGKFTRVVFMGGFDKIVDVPFLDFMKMMAPGREFPTRTFRGPIIAIKPGNVLYYEESEL